MNWSDPLDEILGSRAKIRVLRCLSRSERALSAREVARATRLSHTGALRALEDLRQQDVVALSEGARLGYAMNREHVLVRAGIAPLLDLEARLDEHLAAFVLEIVPVALSVILFGSAARKEDIARSDLDLLVVVPNECDPVQRFDALAGADALTRLGKSVRPVVWTLTELRRHAKRQSALARSALDEGRVLAGTPPRVLILSDSRARRAAG